MSAVLKVIGVEQACNTTPNTFNSAKLLRVTETGTGNALITRNDGANNYTFTLRLGTTEYVEKAMTDTLSSNTTTVVAVPVAFRN